MIQQRDQLDELRRDRGALLNELQRAGADVQKPGAIRCPFHDDQHASAGIYRATDSVWRYKCQACGAGGDVFDVRAKALGRPMSDVLRDHRQSEAIGPARPKQPQRQRTGDHKPSRIFPSVDAMVQSVTNVSDIYRYTNPDTGRVDMVVIRREFDDGSKRFLQARPVEGGFELKAPQQPWPLYGRDRIIDSDYVIIVEGEKCCDALQAIGVPAVTSPGGAGKAEHCDWSPIAGKKAFLWPDNDPPDPTGKRKGIAHMHDVAKIIEKLDPPARLFWIDPDELGLPSKGDVVDYLQQHDDKDHPAKRYAIDEVLLSSSPIGPSAVLGDHIEDIISGRYREVDLPWPALTGLTCALVPGSVTILCGPPEAAKTFFVLECLDHWDRNGVKVAALELEESPQHYLTRALAQQAEQASVLDLKWARAHPDEMRRLWQEHGDRIDRIGRLITTDPDHRMTLKDVAVWVERQAQAGKRVIVVDPISAAVTGDKRWTEDHELMMAVKRTAMTYEVSVLMTNHPVKGSKSPGLDDMAGGSAYAKFASCALWITKHEPPLEETVIAAFGKTVEMFNRTVAIYKARNGRGGGVKLAFNLNPSMRFTELGPIVK